MSIIYNALQKTQQNRQKETEANATSTKNLFWVKPSLLALAVLAIAIALYYSIKPTVTPKTASTATAVAKTPHYVNETNFKNEHTVTGVYLSKQEKIALINNKFVHLGDMIDGLKVVSIEPNRIILRNADNALILPIEQS